MHGIPDGDQPQRQLELALLLLTLEQLDEHTRSRLRALGLPLDQLARFVTSLIKTWSPAAPHAFSPRVRSPLSCSSFSSSGASDEDGLSDLGSPLLSSDADSSADSDEIASFADEQFWDAIAMDLNEDDVLKSREAALTASLKAQSILGIDVDSLAAPVPPPRSRAAALFRSAARRQHRRGTSVSTVSTSTSDEGNAVKMLAGNMATAGSRKSSLASGTSADSRSSSFSINITDSLSFTDETVSTSKKGGSLFGRMKEKRSRMFTPPPPSASTGSSRSASGNGRAFNSRTPALVVEEDGASLTSGASTDDLVATMANLHQQQQRASSRAAGSPSASLQRKPSVSSFASSSSGGSAGASSTSTGTSSLKRRRRAAGVAESLSEKSDPLPKFPSKKSVILENRILHSELITKHYPVAQTKALFGGGSKKEWKPRLVSMSSFATPPGHSSAHDSIVTLHCFKVSSTEEQELERLELTKDSVVCVPDEAPGHQLFALKVSGIGVSKVFESVSSRGGSVPYYKRVETSWMLGMHSADTLKDWLAMLREVVGEIVEAHDGNRSRAPSIARTGSSDSSSHLSITYSAGRSHAASTSPTEVRGSGSLTKEDLLRAGVLNNGPASSEMERGSSHGSYARSESGFAALFAGEPPVAREEIGDSIDPEGAHGARMASPSVVIVSAASTSQSARMRRIAAAAAADAAAAEAAAAAAPLGLSSLERGTSGSQAFNAGPSLLSVFPLPPAPRGPPARVSSRTTPPRPGPPPSAPLPPLPSALLSQPQRVSVQPEAFADAPAEAVSLTNIIDHLSGLLYEEPTPAVAASS